jgi:biopolymer transport protein ExbD
MSHGPVSEGSSAEPNLVPLLDVVFQLIMFFLMCTNFVQAQISEDIALPDSMSARPMDKTETDVLFLNLKPFNLNEFKGRVPDDELELLQAKFKDDPDQVCVPIQKENRLEVMRLRDVKVWLKQQYADAERNTTDGKVKTAVIIRAHRNTDYTHVYQLLNICKSIGFTNLKLRALSKSGVSS